MVTADYCILGCDAVCSGREVLEERATPMSYQVPPICWQ
jgi:hypothetical protein